MLLLFTKDSQHLPRDQRARNVHWDVNKLDKVSNKAHDRKSNGDRFRNLEVLCQRMSAVVLPRLQRLW